MNVLRNFSYSFLWQIFIWHIFLEKLWQCERSKYIEEKNLDRFKQSRTPSYFPSNFDGPKSTNPSNGDQTFIVSKKTFHRENFYKLLQTWSNFYKLLQTFTKLDQTFTNFDSVNTKGCYRIRWQPTVNIRNFDSEPTFNIRNFDRVNPPLIFGGNIRKSSHCQTKL